MNQIHENISHVVTHARSKQQGHDAFVLKYSKMVTLEKLGIDKKSSPQAFDNRHQISTQRNAIDQKLRSLILDEKMKNEEYAKGLGTLTLFEDRYRLGQSCGLADQTVADAMSSSTFT